MAKLAELEAKQGELLGSARGIVERAQEDGERELTKDERGEIDTLLKQVEDVKRDVLEARKDQDIKHRIDGLDAEFLRAQQQEPQGGNGKATGGTLGHRLIESDAWKAWMAQAAPTGQFGAGQIGRSPVFDAKGLSAAVLGRKELITGLAQDSAGAFITPDDTGIYEPIGRYPTRLRDLISVRQTDSDTVEFVRQTRMVEEAAETPEANVKEYTAYPGQIEGRKPQGQMNWERVSETVKTIAVWVGATKRALADAGQLRGLIDQELREALVDRLETQLFNGDGIGENFRGIANQPGTLVQAFNVDILTTTRQAITNLMVNGRQMPTAWVFSPGDWETVELLQDGNNRYYHGGPLQLGPYRLWGVPVVQSFHCAGNVAWLANWRKAVLWDRQQSTITATDSHEDWFVRNMIAILGEMRAAFGLIRPSAFVETQLV